MIPLSAAAVAEVVGGDLVDGPAHGDVTSVTIDSRTVTDGALFVALRGEHADGHAYVGDAFDRGAAAALVEQGGGVPGCIEVDDVADALLGLGAWVRDRVDPTVVAVTGSSGKTTTKDLLRAALSPVRRVVANIGSYNNELGVPLTCCELTEDTEVLVSEIGARGIGHIAAMAQVVRPDVSVVTNVGAAHLEMFRDVDAVARAKSELVAALEPGGVAVLNADDPLVAAMAKVTVARVVTYGTGADANVRPERVELDEHARPTFTVRGVRVSVPLPGEHNVANALAALAAAEACGVAIDVAAEGIAGAHVSRWRMEVVEAAGDVTVLNDAYNANPSSMTAALHTLARFQARGRRWAVLGHMAELGSGGVQAHRRIGRLCAELGLDGLAVVGDGARPIADGADAGEFAGELLVVDGADDAVIELGRRLRSGDVVLVKASRSAGLERVAEALAQREDAA